MPPVRIAVAGAGLIGRKHIAVLRAGQPEYELAAVTDPSSAAKSEAETLGYRWFADLGEMLDTVRPEGVVVAVPNQLHVAVGLACIDRRVPILIEKPVAGSVGEALQLVEAAEAANVATLTGHHRRHNPIMRAAAEAIAAGRIGRVVAATATWLLHKPKGYHDVAWRREPGGGPVLINAIHDIDSLRMLVGEIDTVQAADSTAVRGFAVEDTAAAVLRFKNGALGTLIVSDTAATPWGWEVASGENPFFPQGPEDCIRIAGTSGALSVPHLDVSWQEAGRESWGSAWTQSRLHITPADPYFAQMRNFAAVIRGTEAPVLSGRDGTRTLAATLAITQSARNGGTPVCVDDLMQR